MKVSAPHHNKITHIETQRLILCLPPPAEAVKVVRYLQKNREHLANSGPAYPQDYFNQSFWEERLAQNIADAHDDKSLRMFMYEKLVRSADKTFETNESANLQPSILHSDIEDELAYDSDIIGGVNLNEIVRRAAQFCYLGYGIDEHHQGCGLMTEAVQAIVKHAFEEMNIHRIMANYMPINKRSGALLERLGFTVEGTACDYLHINGKWQDHVLTSLTNPQWKPNLT